MQKYRVGILEIWMRTMLIGAESREEAIDLVADTTKGEEQDFSMYGYVPTEDWPVEETEPEELFLEALHTINELTAALKSVGVPETSSFFYRANALSQRMGAAYERTTGKAVSD